MNYMVDQFTPKRTDVPNYGKWSVFQEIKHLVSGPALGIDGKMYACPGIRAWEHVPGVPWFKTEREAAEVMIDLRKL